MDTSFAGIEQRSGQQKLAAFSFSVAVSVARIDRLLRSGVL
jgi:hypothetical protein